MFHPSLARHNKFEPHRSLLPLAERLTRVARFDLGENARRRDSAAGAVRTAARSSARSGAKTGSAARTDAGADAFSNSTAKPRTGGSAECDAAAGKANLFDHARC